MVREMQPNSRRLAGATLACWIGDIFRHEVSSRDGFRAPSQRRAYGLSSSAIHCLASLHSSSSTRDLQPLTMIL